MATACWVMSKARPTRPSLRRLAVRRFRPPGSNSLRWAAAWPLKHFLQRVWQSRGWLAWVLLPAALVYGGLKPQPRRALRQIAEDLHANKARKLGDGLSFRSARPPPRAPVLSPGTRLLREWNGRMESVEVTGDGFVWRDDQYRTLSAVAVAITGTKWSGPKFFGLRAKRSPLPLSAYESAGAC